MQLKSLLILPSFVYSALALVSAVDSSTLVSVATYEKALGEGFTKAIIRGYEEACGSPGGKVDPNFVSSYHNARSAGYTDIDMYWFPCTGANNPCKSFATQLSEISSTFSANSMDIGTIWIDLEADSVCNNVCNKSSSSVVLHVLILSPTVELRHFWKSSSSSVVDSCYQSNWLQLWHLQYSWSK